MIVVTAGMNARLDAVLDFALERIPHERIPARSAIGKLAGRRVLFAFGIGAFGPDEEVCAMIRSLRADETCMTGSIGAMLLDGARRTLHQADGGSAGVGGQHGGVSFYGQTARGGDRLAGELARAGEAPEHRTAGSIPSGSA
jgi:hypothetical protein